MNRLRHLHQAGVSIWLDDLSRELLESGEFDCLVTESSVTGATSNPAIFAEAIKDTNRYDPQLRELLAAGSRNPRDIFFELALEDVRRAAKILLPVFLRSSGNDGFVSFECTPDLADDPEATVAQALWVRDRLQFPNLLIKVAATNAGIRAIQELTALGVSVNATLLFSLQRYEETIGAYWDGLERRVSAGRGLSVAGIHSVASFFVARVDAEVDSRLEADSPLRGRIAIANAKRANARYLASLEGPRWGRLEGHGAQPQRPLWASTATKDPSYSDVRYVQELIAPGTINTIPLKTLHAFADHGDVASSLGADVRQANEMIVALSDAGVDFDALTDKLERQGVDAFRDSYRDLLGSIENSIARLTAEQTGQAEALDTARSG